MMQGQNFVIEDLTYIPVGEYMPMYSRPYIMHPTQEAVDTISTRLVQNGGHKVTPSILSGVTSNLIQPYGVGFQSPVDNSWLGTKRHIFLLKIKCLDMVGMEITSYIQGYTEYDGISNNGNIDPALVHFVNNVIETTGMTYNTPLGIVRSEKLHKIYNVISNTTSNELYTQRPDDIMGIVASQSYANIAPDMTGEYLPSILSSIDGKVVSSDADNSITTQYLGKILNTAIQKSAASDQFVSSMELNGDMYSNSHIPEPDINDNSFLRHISRLSGHRIVRNFFQFQTLMSVDPTIYNRFKLLRLTKNMVDNVTATTPSVGDYWHGQDIVTNKAYSIIENSVAIAIKYGFNKIYFTASNMANPLAAPEIFITNFNSFINLSDMEFNQLLEMFKTAFMLNVFLNESQSGAIGMHMEMYVDLLGTSKINLTYAGYPSNWYTIPTFANSLFSPITTVDKNGLDLMAHQFGDLFGVIGQHILPTHTQQPYQY